LGDANSDDWATPTNPNNGKLFGLSHLTFYDTGSGIPPAETPEPTILLLLFAGLMGVIYTQRRNLYVI